MDGGAEKGMAGQSLWGVIPIETLTDTFESGKKGKSRWRGEGRRRKEKGQNGDAD